MLAETTKPEEAPDVRQLLRRHYVFIRKARDTSHQCLFFLGMLRATTTRKGNEAVKDYSGFALEQVKSLIGGVHIPDETAYRHWQEQLATLPADQRQEVALAVSLLESWLRIFGVLENLENFNAADFRRSLIRFLADSRCVHQLDRVIVHWLPECLTFFRKNLALIWGGLILLAVVLEVEAVRSLLWNEGWGVLLPLALLLVPLLVSRGWIFYRSLAPPEAVPFWDISGSAFRSFRYQALEPGRLIDRWPKHDKLGWEITKGQLVKLAFYTAWWVAAFLAIALLERTDSGVLGLSDSSLTVFLVFSLFYTVLILAHVVDFWEYLDPRPVRFLILLVSLSGTAFLLLGYGREFFIAASLLAAAGYFYTYFRSRQGVSLSLAFVFIGLATLNLIGRNTHQRAVWTEKEGTSEAAWQRLGPGEWPWPGNPDGSGPPIVVLAASGGGSRAAVYTGLVLCKLNEDFPEIARQIQAISSVSGGSLANAAYTVRLLDLHEQSADPAARLKALEGLNKELGSDFLFPTLLGALVPGLTRGKAIEENWQDKDRVGLGEHRLSTLANQWRSALTRRSPNPPFPIPLFNSSTLDGHDVVFSPFQKELYSPDDQEARSRTTNEYYREAGNDAYTWVYYRDGIYGLEDLLGDFDPLLSQSVRASANFPFGFPLVQIETERPLFFSPGGFNEKKKRVDLTDGGALSNSGMWSLYHLLAPDEKEQLEALKKRGVLLIVIEASKMPLYPQLEQSLNSLWSTIGDQGPVGQHLHRLMFDMLQEKYGDQIAIVQLDLVPRQNYNVLTSWALDKRSHEKLLNSFQMRWKEEREMLKASWRILHDKAQRGDHRLVNQRRPPLD